jgi:hypothetical protein
MKSTRHTGFEPRRSWRGCPVKLFVSKGPPGPKASIRTTSPKVTKRQYRDSFSDTRRVQVPSWYRADIRPLRPSPQKSDVGTTRLAKRMSGPRTKGHRETATGMSPHATPRAVRRGRSASPQACEILLQAIRIQTETEPNPEGCASAKPLARPLLNKPSNFL